MWLNSKFALCNSTVPQKYNASHKCHLNFSCDHNTKSKKRISAMNFNKLFYLIKNIVISTCDQLKMITVMRYCFFVPRLWYPVYIKVHLNLDSNFSSEILNLYLYCTQLKSWKVYSHNYIIPNILKCFLIMKSVQINFQSEVKLK